MKSIILLALKLYCGKESTYFPFFIVSMRACTSISFTERVGLSGSLLSFAAPQPNSLLLQGSKITYLIDESAWLSAFWVYLSDPICPKCLPLCSSLWFAYWDSPTPKKRPAILELGWIQFERVLLQAPLALYLKSHYPISFFYYKINSFSISCVLFLRCRFWKGRKELL